ncbi:MAG TPA: methyltransferase domain-containing protein, partial [Pyrinomonadaceae bacterium]
ARQRLGRSADIRQLDLREPLTFLGSSSIDVVLSPLVLDYINDWRSTFAEFYRVLRAGGHFVFSVCHPFFAYSYYKTDNYFETELVGCEWRGFEPVRVWMPSFRRPLGEVLNPLVEAGFILEKMTEAQPTDEFKDADPKDYEELSKRPGFLCIRARK